MDEQHEVGKRYWPVYGKGRKTGYTYNRTLAVLLACSVFCTLLLAVMQITASIRYEALESKLNSVLDTQSKFNQKTLAFNRRLVNDVFAIQENQGTVIELYDQMSDISDGVADIGSGILQSQHNLAKALR